ncbi:MAG: pitrilysin family protein [bacterium]
MRHGKLILALGLLALAAAALLLSCESQQPLGVITVDKPGIPLVHFRVMVNAGSAFDPDDKPGLAYFTAHLLDKGTRSFSRSQIESRLDNIGATLEIEVGKETVVFKGKTLSENLEQFYAIFLEMLTAPTFPKAEIASARQDQLEAIGRIREDDTQLSLAVFENVMFEGHPYGHIVQGSESAVSGFTREDALDFYRKYYLQGNLYAGIGGDINDSLTVRLRRDLAVLPEGHIVRWQDAPRYCRGHRVVLVEKENRTQSQLRIGHLLDCDRRDADYFPLRLAGCWLGEHREGFGHLFNAVREDRGLAYGAYAYTEYFEQAGWSKQADNGIVRNYQYFHMWTYPKEENFEFCFKLMTRDLEALSQNGIGMDDFTLVQEYVRNSYAFLVETPDKQLGMLMDERWYDTPDFVSTYQQRVAAVGREAVNQAAAKYLKPNDLLYVAVVSDGEAAMAQLLTPGAELQLPSGTEEGDLATINAEIKRYELGLNPQDITIIPAEELFR